MSLSYAAMLLWVLPPLGHAFEVGISAVDVTPKGYEYRPTPDRKNPLFFPGDAYDDSNHDGEYQFLPLGGFRPVYPPKFGNRYATGVHDPIWSRTIAFRGDNGIPLILVSIDLPSLGWKVSGPIRRRVAKEIGVPVGNIVIANTHAHHGPDAAGYFVTLLKNHNDPYVTQLEGQVYDSIVQAWKGLRPARMKTLTTTHVACYDPRTMELKKDPNCRIPSIREPMELDDGTHFDHWLVQADKRDPIVRNTRIVVAHFETFSGQALGTFVNWNNHPDSASSVNMMVSSDYAHYLRHFVESHLGGTTVYFTGTLGAQIGSSATAGAPLWSEDGVRAKDSSGRPIIVKNGWDMVRSTGFEVGSEVVSAVQSKPWFDGSVDVSVKTDSLDSPVDNFLHLVATRSVWTHRVEPEDKMIRTRKGRCSGTNGCVRSDLSVIQIGDLGLVTAPGEVDPAYLLGRDASKGSYGFPFGKWKFPAMPGWDRFMPGKHHAVLGQANNYLSYLIHEPDNHGWWNVFHPNHYEELVTISRTFGDDVGNKMMSMLGSSERFSDAPVPEPATAEVELPGEPGSVLYSSLTKWLFDWMQKSRERW